MTSHIRIVRVPPGEAPQWVREKWVGLRLPLRQRKLAPLSFPVAGVLTGPRTWWSSVLALFRGSTDQVNGYAVSVTAAVDELAKHSPEAASWWRSETPHMFRATRFFVFHAEVAEIVSEEEPRASA